MLHGTVAPAEAGELTDPARFRPSSPTTWSAASDDLHTTTASAMGQTSTE